MFGIFNDITDPSVVSIIFAGVSPGDDNVDSFAFGPCPVNITSNYEPSATRANITIVCHDI